MKKLLLASFFILHSSFFICCFAQNTMIYGMAPSGGANSDGVFYDYNLTTNTPGTLVNFAGTSNGSSPYGGLTPDYATGYLYGMTYSGGTYNLGELFSYNVCKGETTVVNFQSNNAQAHPYGNLIYDTLNGLFYGMTSQGGAYNDGVLFSFDPTTNAETLLVTFNGTNGANPHGSLDYDPVNGLFYGMTYGGGTSNWGVIFTFNPNTNALSVVNNLASSLYAGYGYGNLTWDPSDSMFGVMTSGVGAGGGNLFYYNPKLNTFVEYTSFRGIWGDYPYGSLTYDPVNKRLYGMTEEQPFGGLGNIFWYTPTPANFGNVLSFNGGTEGKYPYGNLTWDPSTGLFYGTAQMGGANDSGVMYSINPTTNAQTVLINFSKAIGALPYNDLMYDPATQMLYGMTYAGGTNNDGVIYKYDVGTNTETVLANFNGTNGANPWGDLAYDPVNGKLYGLTLNGGANGNGSIIMLDTTMNTESAVFSFSAYSSKENLPYGKMAVDPVDGDLYGMSSGGGSYNYGTIFKVNPITGKDTTLLSFNNTAYPMGATPYGSLAYDTANGLFYGMTYAGGSANEGVLFSFNPITGKDSTLVNFTGTNGQYPEYTTLTYDPANQLFYGTTLRGGTNGYGCIFSFNPVTNIETVVYNGALTATDGFNFYGSLTYNPVDGLLYGATDGGANSDGTIFSFNTTTNTFTSLFSFNNPVSGYVPVTSPYFNPADSCIYGTTQYGGSSYRGLLYKFKPSTNTETLLETFTGTNGENPVGDLCIITSPKPTITFSGNSSITCPTNSATINANAPGGSTFLWSTGATTSSITVNLSFTTTYSLTVCNGFYYKDTAVTVNVISSVNANISSISYEPCYGGSTGGAMVSVTSGQSPFTYLWAPGGNTGASISNVSAGNYMVTVTDANGCANTAIADITQPPALNDSMRSACATCCNCKGKASDSIFGGTAPYTFLWSNGGTTDTITGLSGGSYTCTVTDAHGCTKTDTVWVTNGEHITPSSSSVSCYGGSDGTATAEVIPGFNFIWTPSGQTTATATGLSAGTYSVTVTNQDTSGCIATLVFTVVQPPQLNVSATVLTTPGCSGGTGSASASASGGTPGYNYSWAPSGGNGSVANGLSAGTYVVTVTDANGCTAQASVTISEPQPLSGYMSIYPPNSYYDYCSDTTCYYLTPMVTGGTQPYNYSYIPNPICSSSSVLLDVTDANGCFLQLISSVYVGLSSRSQINNNATCYGGNNGSATIIIYTDFYDNISYSWSPGGGTSATESNLSAGTYTVTITDNMNSCVNTKIITITQPPLLNITYTVVPAACSTPGSATASVSNGTAPYTYSWSGGNGTNASATGLIAGTYTVTVTDNHGCSNTAMVTVTGSGLNITPTAINYVTCRGGTNGSASATVSGGVSPYTYLWSNSQTTTSISGLSAGTYTITITDANNCQGLATVTITQPNQLSVTGNQSSNIPCNGESTGGASASVSGGTSPYTYLWSNGGSNSTTSNLSAGTYTVTAYDNCGSSTTAAVAITEPAILSTAIIVNTNISCNGGSNGFIFANPYGGTPGYTYSWVAGGTYNAQTGLSSGTYTVVVTDANGCSVTASKTLTQPFALSVSANVYNNVSCNNGTNGSAGSTVSGGTKPYTYLWTGGGTTASISNLSAGTYTITVHDSCGASVTATAIITQPNALNVSANAINNISCYNGNNGSAGTTVSGGTKPYTYLWTGGSTTSSISNLSTGTYSLTVQDSCGNSATSSTTITQPAALTISGDSINDNGSCNGSAWAIVSGGTNPYTYLWTGGNTTDSIFSKCFGNYCCVVTDANGCLDSVCVTINLATVSNQLSEINSKITIYPNPNNGKFDVICHSERSEGSPLITIYNELGQNILTETLRFSQGDNHINLSEQPSGVYFYRVTKEDGSLLGQGKLVIQR